MARRHATASKVAIFMSRWLLPVHEFRHKPSRIGVQCSARLSSIFMEHFHYLFAINWSVLFWVRADCTAFMFLVYIFSPDFVLNSLHKNETMKITRSIINDLKKKQSRLPVFCFNQFHKKISSKKQWIFAWNLFIMLAIALRVIPTSSKKFKSPHFQQPMMSHTTEKKQLGSLEWSSCKNGIWQNSIALQMADPWIAVLWGRAMRRL